MISRARKIRPNLLIPAGISVVSGPSGARFRGSACAFIPRLVGVLREFSREAPGSARQVGQYTFFVSANPPINPEPYAVYLPGEAWNIFASKIGEVASGREASPFDFRMCGYLWPPPDPDVGVELIGEPMHGA